MPRLLRSGLQQRRTWNRNHLNDVTTQLTPAIIADANTVNQIPAAINAHGPWEAIGEIGEGGQGRVLLFGRFDDHNTLQERVTLKEVQADRPMWADTQLFWTNANHTESMETFLHRTLDAIGSNVFNGYVGQSTDRPQWRYKIYTTFSPHGTLEDLIEHYRDREYWERVEGDKFPLIETADETDVLPYVWIPEPFIWYCFDQLCTASIIMQRGADANTSVAGWDEIVHRDIKPCNVFLDHPLPNQRHWQVYPVPKLADFGLAYRSPANESTEINPRSLFDAGTPDFAAPEQFSARNRTSRNFLHTPRISAPSHVYAIGVVMLCLICRSNNPPTCDIWAAEITGPEGLPPDGSYPEIPYSYDLISLVEDCTHPNPALRPTLDAVRTRIRPPAQLDPDGTLYQNMRKMKPSPNRPYWDQRKAGLKRLDLEEDRYRLGLARHGTAGAAVTLPPPP